MSSSQDDPDAWGRQRQREWDRLNRLKSELRWKSDEPLVFSTPGEGEVTVRDWWLEGGPGWEYVRAKFTYKNTTDVPMAKVYIEMSITDENDNVLVASRVKLTHPWGWPIRPGALFSDEITTPTDGAHLDPEGWRWKIDIRGLPETDGYAAPAR